MLSSHLEQADTGLETRNKGLSEKLDLGIVAGEVVGGGEWCPGS